MPSIIYKINKLLESKKVSKKAFADKIGVSRDTLYGWTDENLKVSALLKTCQVLDVSIDYFLNPATASEPAANYKKAPPNQDYVLTQTIEVLNKTITRMEGHIEDLRRENETLTAVIKQKDEKTYTGKKKQRE